MFGRVGGQYTTLTAATRTFSLPKSQCFTFSWTVFSTQVRSGKLILSPFVNIFPLRHASPYISHILLEISHGLHFSAAKDLMTDLCSSQEDSIRFATILNCIKTNIFVRRKIFLPSTNSHQCGFDVYGKKFWKKNYFACIQKNLLIH